MADEDQRRPLLWEGSAKKDFKRFPTAVQKDMGVLELVEDHRGATYRAVYTVRISEQVHVLHAFQKKSKSGIKTPLPDVELVGQRLKAVLEQYRVKEKD